MHTRPETYGAQEHLDDLDYLIAHLGPDPVGAQFVPEVQAIRDALSGRMGEWALAERDVTAAQAGMIVAEEKLSNAVRTARDRIMEEVDHDRRSRKMATYLPHGLTGVTTGPFLDEVNSVRVLAAHCAQDPSPNLQALSAVLLAVADEAKAAFDRRQDAVVAEGTAYGNVRVEKLNASDMARRIDHRLLEALNNDRHRVNSFFRPVSKSSRKGEAKSEDDATPGSASTETPEQ